MQTITLLYFGDLMAKLLIGRETLRLPPSVKDVAGLAKLLAQRGGEWQAAFSQARTSLHVTVNKKEAEWGTPLAGGDEVAFIESVSI